MDSVVEWRSGLSQVTIVQKRKMIGLKTKRGLIAYPTEKFSGWRDWNALMLAYNMAMGTVNVRISYPESYEYRWIFDPLVEKYPELWTDSPSGYYTLLLLTEETVLTGRAGPATRRTLERIAEYVEHGVKVKLGDVQSERRAGVRVSDTDVARLFLVYGFHRCRRTRDCPKSYGQITRTQLLNVSNLIVEEIVPVIFTEELVRVYAGRTGTLPVVYTNDEYTRMRSGPSPLFTTVLEQLAGRMTTGRLDNDLSKIFGRVEPGVRVQTSVEDNTVRLRLYIPGAGGDPLIVRFTVGELLRRVNRLLQESLVMGRSHSSLVEALRITPRCTENLVSDSRYGRSNALLLAGDHAVYYPEWPETGGARTITSLDGLIELLSGRMGLVRAFNFLYRNREKLLSQASRLDGISRTIPDCFPCEEKLVETSGADGRRTVLGRYKDYYVLLEDGTVSVGTTLYSVLPHDFGTALRVLEHFGLHDDKEALVEANRIIKETVDVLGIEHMWAHTNDSAYTSYSTGTGSIIVIITETGKLEEKVGPLLRGARPVTGKLAVLEHVLRMYGWRRETRGKIRAYRKGNVHVVLGGRR